MRGVEGMVEAIRTARETGLPFLGICLGMQVAIVEFARNVVGLERQQLERVRARVQQRRGLAHGGATARDRHGRHDATRRVRLSPRAGLTGGRSVRGPRSEGATPASLRGVEPLPGCPRRARDAAERTVAGRVARRDRSNCRSTRGSSDASSIPSCGLDPRARIRSLVDSLRPPRSTREPARMRRPRRSERPHRSSQQPRHRRAVLSRPATDRCLRRRWPFRPMLCFSLPGRACSRTIRSTCGSAEYLARLSERVPGRHHLQGQLRQGQPVQRRRRARTRYRDGPRGPGTGSRLHRAPHAHGRPRAGAMRGGCPSRRCLANPRVSLPAD